MKHLKKLTRKGLDELAKEMPQVNVKQQSGMVAGASYYNDMTLWHVGNVGYGDSIYVIGGYDYGQMIETVLNCAVGECPIFPEDRYEWGGLPINIASEGIQYGFFSSKLSGIPNLSGLVINNTPYDENSNWYVSGGIVNINIYNPAIGIFAPFVPGSPYYMSGSTMDVTTYSPYYFTESDVLDMQLDVSNAIEAEMAPKNNSGI